MKENIKPGDIKCMLCPNKQGAFKRIDQNNWAHVVCVNWIEEIWYKNDK